MRQRNFSQYSLSHPSQSLSFVFISFDRVWNTLEYIYIYIYCGLCSIGSSMWMWINSQWPLTSLVVVCCVCYFFCRPLLRTTGSTRSESNIRILSIVHGVSDEMVEWHNDFRAKCTATMHSIWMDEPNIPKRDEKRNVYVFVNWSMMGIHNFMINCYTSCCMQTTACHPMRSLYVWGLAQIDFASRSQ